MKRNILTCAAIALVFTVVASAQMGPMQKSPELDKLNFLVGEWNSQDELYFNPGAEPNKTTGLSNFSWEVGDLWLKQDFVSNMGPMGTMYGVGYITWDTEKGVYINHWIDNFSTANYTTTGSFNEDGGLVFTGTQQNGPVTIHDRYTWQKMDDGSVVFLLEQSTDGTNYRLTLKSTLTKK